MAAQMASTTAPSAGMWRRGRSGLADGHRGGGCPTCAIDAPGAVGAEGARERRVRPQGWRAALLRVRGLFPARSALRRAVPSRVPCRPLLGGHMFLHVLPRSALSELRSGVFMFDKRMGI